MAAVVMMAIELRPRSAIVKAIALVAAVFALLTTAAVAFSTPERNGWVTDQAGILDADSISGITTLLIDLQGNTGAEVVVVTLSSLHGASIESWGEALGDSWRVGRSGDNDTGVLLIVAPNDRKVRIAVGYGLGNRISDPIAAMIISDHILPYFRQGDFARGIRSGINSIALELNPPRATTVAPNSTAVERAAPVAIQQPSLWTRLRRALTPILDIKVNWFWVAVFVVVGIWMVLNVGNVGSGRRRRRASDGYDYNSYDDDGWWSSSSSGGSSSSGSSSGGSSSGGGASGGGATGSW